ncbi:hypothetical protein [Asaia bogorensis]|uniref:hypothetical protein n=1 Tax=Asaia bogorensis TaxID=91915 RepID=UPI0013CEB48A|nr:hypothetical protein [Asaia bogorensis]
MLKFKATATILLLIFVFNVSAHSAFSAEAISHDSSELKKLFHEDQSDRATPNINWKKLSEADNYRISIVEKMLKNNGIKTGLDYYEAAFIEQHGSNPKNYLLAHIFSIVSLSKGYKRASWISAATLDRYLITIGKPQIFGTQTHYDLDKNGDPIGEASREPFDSELVSDNVRNAMNITNLKDLAERLRKEDFSSNIEKQ